MKSKLLFILTFILFPFFSNDVYANENEFFFVVTAYYSPLPDQEHYSYSVYTKRERTYIEEKRLQGEGIRGASGKKVFSGMLAAPKNYKFGTKIYLDGLGVGEIADRGGAIVNKGVRGYGHDRIDVWMGYGDEGLKRATYWGKRKIKGKFLNKTASVNLDYNTIPSPDWVIKSNTKKIKEIIAIKENKINIFNKKLTKNIEIKKLQEVLIEMGLYSGDIDGEYEKIINSIYDYQLSKNIVKSVSSPGAGSYGPITRKALNKDYNLFLEKKEKERLELVRIEEEKKKEELKLKELANKYIELEHLSSKKANNKLASLGKPKFGDVSQSVRELQVILNKLGFFNYKDTAIYGNITKNSIISYQLDRKIINSKTDYGAGIVGPKTRNAIKNDLKKDFLNNLVKLENIDFSEIVLINDNEA